MDFFDPYKKNLLYFDLIPIDRLEVISMQRKPSKQHIEALINSIIKLGFIVPIIVYIEATFHQT